MGKKDTKTLVIAVGVFVIIVVVGIAYESATGLHIFTGEKKTSGVGSDKWVEQEETTLESTSPFQPTESVQSAISKPDCDKSYPTVCIPQYPPDLDCGEIQFNNFEVLQPDPHGFDSDKDGIGCEG